MLEILNPTVALHAIQDFLEAGGGVLFAIMIATFLMWALILERLIYFSTAQGPAAKRRERAWAAREDHSSWYAHRIRERLISEQRQLTEQYLAVIRALIAVTPLLGLLGTVTGMVQVFDVMAATGSSNARLMAAGISKATIPTMAGLVASLSGVFFINILDRQASRTIGNLADSLEIHLESK